jgi:hypothetical protein
MILLDLIIFGRKKESLKDKLIILMDLLIFGLVLSLLFNDLVNLLQRSHIWMDSFNYINSDLFCYAGPNEVNEAASSANNTRVTKTVIIRSEDGWGTTIRQIFIYGTGTLRFALLKGGGTPVQRYVVIGSTLVAEGLSKFVTNAINDPRYIEEHSATHKSWGQTWTKDGSTVHLPLRDNSDNNSETLNKIKDAIANNADTVEKINSLPNLNNKTDALEKDNIVVKNFNGMDDLSNDLVKYIVDLLRPVLEPVHVNYPNELLATQIHGISILLFILSVLIIILLVAFIINILVWLYSDRLMNLFTNKYIRWYINFNKKIIGIEVFFIGISLIYFMYILSYGIHFIATHPIILS